MLKKVALLLVLCAIGFHIYLTLHFYELNYGFAVKESVCNLNSQFNCDTVTASSYSSFLGAPIALWGATTNFALAILLVIWILGWSAHTARLGRYALILSGLTVIASLVMGTISTFLIGSYCLFCIGAYLASFISFAFILKAQEPDTTRPLALLFRAPKAYYALALAIPLMTLFAHRSYLLNIGAENLKSIVNSSVAEWESGPKYDFAETPPSMTKGAENAAVTITEFADFRCSHCKQASAGIKAFVAGKPDVKMQFYSFPLDSTCNEVIPGGGGDGISCLLAKSVFCAEKTAQKGWAMHDFLFSIQEQINEKPSLAFAQEQVTGAAQNMQIPIDSLKACVEDATTDAAIRAQAKLGERSNVKGTPTFYLNSKKLIRGQLIPVIEEAYQVATKKAGSGQ